MSDKILHVTDETFEKEVLNAEDPVLVDYWAEWCGPCKMIAPVLEEIAEEYARQTENRKVEYRRQRRDTTQIRHPRHTDVDAVQRRECRSYQGRRRLQVAALRLHRQQYVKTYRIPEPGALDRLGNRARRSLSRVLS